MRLAIDPALEDALRQAVSESGQPATVTARLVAWLRALSEGEDSKESMAGRYEELLETLNVVSDGAD